jgi:osmotically-inducible protein OsmY
LGPADYLSGEEEIGMAISSEKLKTKIYDAIKGQLKPGNYISVSVKSVGFIFGKRVVELTGRASSDKDKETIERIARELSEGLEVVSTVRTSRTG